MFGRNIYAQDEREKVIGGFRKCTVNYYTYKFGKLDLKSKEKSKYSRYDDKGNLV
jgi:hypothetical protein